MEKRLAEKNFYSNEYVNAETKTFERTLLFGIYRLYGLFKRPSHLVGDVYSPINCEKLGNWVVQTIVHSKCDRLLIAQRVSLNPLRIHLFIVRKRKAGWIEA